MMEENNKESTNSEMAEGATQKSSHDVNEDGTQSFIITDEMTSQQPVGNSLVPDQDEDFKNKLLLAVNEISANVATMKDLLATMRDSAVKKSETNRSNYLQIVAITIAFLSYLGNLVSWFWQPETGGYFFSLASVLSTSLLSVYLAVVTPLLIYTLLERLHEV